MAHAEEEVGFWPGYVAAIACLVQSLLLLATILAVAVTTAARAAHEMKMRNAKLRPLAEAPLRPDASLSGAAASPGDGPTPYGPRLDRSLPRPPVQPLDAPLAADPSTRAPAPAPEPEPAPQRSPRTQGAALVIRFLGDALTLPKSAAADISERATAVTAEGAVRWRLSLRTDVRDRRARQAGFLRLAVVRAALLQSGVEPARVEVRLIPDFNDVEDPGASLVVLEAYRADGTPIVPGSVPLRAKPGGAAP